MKILATVGSSEKKKKCGHHFSNSSWLVTLNKRPRNIAILEMPPWGSVSICQMRNGSVPSITWSIDSFPVLPSSESLGRVYGYACLTRSIIGYKKACIFSEDKVNSLFMHSNENLGQKSKRCDRGNSPVDLWQHEKSCSKSNGIFRWIRELLVMLFYCFNSNNISAWKWDHLNGNGRSQLVFKML